MLMVEPSLGFWYSVLMDSESMELKEQRAQYFARWEAVEVVKAHELAAMTDERAREEFLKGYNETVDAGLMPAGDAAFGRLLTVFELEKAVYELRYELNNRPEWIHIPVAGILRMLESPAAA